jgi:hypothetical protein
MNNIAAKEYTRERVIERMDEIEEQLLEEQDAETGKIDAKREFELMYARFMAGLRLNTGMRLY